MNLDKSTKLIAKKVKKGFHGYPQISISYFGVPSESKTEVVVGFRSEEGAAVQEQKLLCEVMLEKTRRFKPPY